MFIQKKNLLKKYAKNFQFENLKIKNEKSGPDDRRSRWVHWDQ